MDDDGPPEWESWMAARNEADLYRQDVEAEARRARLAKAVLARHQAQLESRRAAERLWEAVCALLRG